VRSIYHTLRTESSGLFCIAALVAFFCAFWGLPTEGKRKHHVVAMKNGDKFTGEIKQLENEIR
jgi:hypothetical protein